MVDVDELIQVLELNGTEVLYNDFGLFERISTVVAFGLMGVVGFVANSVMIVILLRMKQTVFVTISLGLSITDLLSSCISQFTVYQVLSLADFALPSFMCSMIATAATATTMVTVHHVLLLTIVRYRGVVHAFDARREVSLKMCRILLVVSWVLSFTLLAFPQFLQLKLKTWKNGVICYMDLEPARWIQVLSVLSISLGIFVPTIMIIGLCLAIVRHLVMRRSSTTVSQSSASKQKEERALRQLKAIVITFLVGYGIDYTGKILILTLRGMLEGNLFVLTLLLSCGILRFTECLNPFLYYYASNEIRSETKRLKEDMQKIFKSGGTSTANAMTDDGTVEAGPPSGTRTVKIAPAKEISN